MSAARPASAYPYRHLLGIEDLEPSHIEAILDTADGLREVLDRPIKKVPALRGKTVVNLFYEPSTRTRSSFEVAEKVLSADSLSIATASSSVRKGETLLDTARNLEAMNPDMIVIRHGSAGAPHFLARHCRSAIVNAGDGAHEHPTQALLDALTLRQKKGRLAGLKVAIVGDLLHSRVARSNLWLLGKLGARLRLCGPPTLVPPGIEALAPVTHRIEEAVAGVDAIMMLRLQRERMSGGFFPTTREYHQRFGLTEERVRLAKKDVLILHPGPMNRGVEIASEVADGPYSVILDQVTNGVAVRMAVLYLLLGGVEAAYVSERLLVKGGRLLDPGQGLDETLDVLIENGRVAQLGTRLSARGAQVVDAAGLVVAPGFIDLHVHLREPGREDRETIFTGTRAAAAGGFSAVCAMPNTEPVNDNAGQTRAMLDRAAQDAVVRVYPIGAITRGSRGEELAEYGDLRDAGCVAVSDDGRPVASARMLRRALEYARAFSLTVIDHCEEPTLSERAAMNEGPVSTLLGLPGAPWASESIVVERDVTLAELTGGKLHIAHLSTAAGVDAVRRGKARGVRVSAEATPHHLLLTDQAVKDSGYDTSTKMNPPLRSEADRRAVLEGVRDGTIDCIATDHAPHGVDDKNVEYDAAAFGVVGLETAVALCLDRLVGPGLLELRQLVALLSTNPARVLGLPGGSLAPGSPADVTLLDLERKRGVDPERFASKGRNTPFGGWTLKGWPVTTIVAGRVVWSGLRG